MNWFNKLQIGFRSILNPPNQNDSSSISVPSVLHVAESMETSSKPTTPTIELPILPTPPTCSPPRIWVVDDEQVNLMVIQIAMSHTEFDIRLFERANDLLNTIRNEQVIPNLILSDVMMPVMSGYELTSIIRNYYAREELPIVMISAKTREEDIRKGLDSGANEYMTKPFAKADLLDKVRTHIKTAS